MVHVDKYENFPYYKVKKIVARVTQNFKGLHFCDDLLKNVIKLVLS